jgi:hypothetical protein
VETSTSSPFQKADTPPPPPRRRWGGTGGAFAAGIRVGDFLLEVAGETTVDKDLGAIKAMLQGAGADVRVRLCRGEGGALAEAVRAAAAADPAPGPAWGCLELGLLQGPAPAASQPQEDPGAEQDAGQEQVVQVHAQKGAVGTEEQPEEQEEQQAQAQAQARAQAQAQAEAAAELAAAEAAEAAMDPEDQAVARRVRLQGEELLVRTIRAFLQRKREPEPRRGGGGGSGTGAATAAAAATTTALHRPTFESFLEEEWPADYQALLQWQRGAAGSTRTYRPWRALFERERAAAAAEAGEAVDAEAAAITMTRPHSGRSSLVGSGPGN